MRKIEITECHAILLDLAKQVHNLCVDNHIPYYMICGTMLGAMRHKGFIPWDDDFDIAIPRPYYAKFEQCARDQLTRPYRLQSYLDDNGISTGFSKIDNSLTIAGDLRYRSLTQEKQFGLYIDVFPLDYCSPDLPGINHIKRLKRLEGILFQESQVNTWEKALGRALLRTFFRFNKNYLLKKIDRIIEKNTPEEKTYLTSYWSHYHKKNTFPIAVYGTPTLYPFEDTQFYGPEKADDYLSHLFGNYMKLPPKEYQQVHCEGLYWKTDK